MKLKLVLPALASLSLAACTYNAAVPPVSGVAEASVGAQQPGHYAVFVQSGGWDMDTKDTAFACSGNTFHTNINPTWESASHQMFIAALEHVDIVPVALTPDQLSAGHYDAGIAVLQSNGTSTVNVTPKFWTVLFNSETKLDAMLSITWPNSSVPHQETVHGTGSESLESGGGCGDMIKPAGVAAANAVSDLLRNLSTTTKLVLAQHH